MAKAAGWWMWMGTGGSISSIAPRRSSSGIGRRLSSKRGGTTAAGYSFSNDSGLETVLAEMLVERVVSVEQIRFTNSGSEGTQMAIRAARAFTGRPKIAKIEGGYHGTHDCVENSVRVPPGAGAIRRCFQ
jgi:hypothetical protein